MDDRPPHTKGALGAKVGFCGLSQKWDNHSSHMIIMLSGASVPPDAAIKS